MANFFTPPQPTERKPESEVKGSYTQLRLQVFIGIFIGYAAYYLVRKNFSLAMPYLIEMGFSKYDLGIAFSFNATA